MVAIVVNGHARRRSRVGMVMAGLGNDYANRHEDRSAGVDEQHWQL